MPYAAKVIGLGVVAKAVVITTVIMILGATTFTQSVILVVISATTTGIFGLLIVLIQTRADRETHRKLDHVESTTQESITQAKDEVTETITSAVTPNGETK